MTFCLYGTFSHESRVNCLTYSPSVSGVICHQRRPQTIASKRLSGSEPCAAAMASSSVRLATW